MILAALVAAALGAEPAPVAASPPAAPTAPAPVTDTPTTAASDEEEIVVWGEKAVHQSREALIGAMKAQGWKPLAGDHDGDLVFQPPEPWMGRAFLSRDGAITFGRPVMKLGGVRTDVPDYDVSDQLHRTEETTATANPSFYVLPSKRLLEGAHARLLDAIKPDLDRYLDTLRVSASHDRTDDLALLLDRLWQDGVPPDGSAPLATPAERRAWILTYWATRADTPDGDQVRGIIEEWLRQTVQASPEPITADERSRAEQQAGRPLPVP